MSSVSTHVRSSVNDVVTCVCGVMIRCQLYLQWRVLSEFQGRSVSGLGDASLQFSVNWAVYVWQGTGEMRLQSLAQSDENAATNLKRPMPIYAMHRQLKKASVRQVISWTWKSSERYNISASFGLKSWSDDDQRSELHKLSPRGAGVSSHPVLAGERFYPFRLSSVPICGARCTS